MQTAQGIIDNALGRGNEGRVMPFGGLNRGMAEQQLDRSQIRPDVQQGHRERVPKAMRVAVQYLGAAEDAIDGAARRTEGRRELTIAAPKKVRRFDRNRGKGAERVLGQANVKVLSGFHSSHHQLAGLHVKAGSLQPNRIGESESGVQQRVEQRAGAEAGALDAGRVVIVDSVASRDHTADFVASERQRGHANDLGRAQFLGGVLHGPVTIGTESEEGAKRSYFFSGSARRDVAARYSVRSTSVRVEPAGGRKNSFRYAREFL